METAAPGTDSELVIRRLYDITSKYDDGLDRQVRDLLLLGCERFRLDIGILANIAGDRYEVVHAVAPDGVELKAGDTFQLGETYCCVTLEADAPVGFEHVGCSEIANHPAYRAVQLEAYIGMPVRPGGVLYGTLNFSSACPLQGRFREVDIEALRLMTAWLEGEMQRRRTEQDLADALARYEQLSRIDPLTETLNRRGLSQYLERLNARDAYQGTSTGVVLIDLDDFKSVNDGYGHSVGDVVIQRTAESVAEAIRPGDMLGRIGGDEFLAVLPGCQSETHCREVAERIRDAVAAQSIEVDGNAVAVTCSIGAAILDPKALSVTRVLVEIEGLLRESKAAGKNCFAFADRTLATAGVAPG